MHILFVTTTFPPDNGWGGIGSYVYHMSRGLIGLGHEVTVLCGAGKTLQNINDGGLKIIRFLQTEGVNNYQIQTQVVKVLFEVIQQHKVDVVEFPEYGATGLEFQKYYPRFPTVVKLHGDYQISRLSSSTFVKKLIINISTKLRPNIYDKMEQETTALAHAIVAPSDSQMQSCLKRGWSLPECRAIIANPFDALSEETTCFSKDYTIPKVVSLGRLDYLKGVSLMPDIFRNVWREVPETQFELLGQPIPFRNGSHWGDWLLSKIPTSYRDRVFIRGGVPYIDIPKYLASHSVAFFASTWESFGYTHIECMYSGIASVIGSKGGSQELGVNGVSCLNTPRNAHNISKALLQLLKNPDLRRKIGLSAHQHILEHYSSQRIATQMLEVYHQAIKRAQQL